MAVTINFTEYKENQARKRFEERFKLSFFKAIEISTDSIIEEIETGMETKKIFSGDRKLFELAFSSLANYWELTFKAEELPKGKEFEKFPLVIDLFEWMKDKIIRENKQGI